MRQRACSLYVCSILINCKASIITYKYTCPTCFSYHTFQKVPRAISPRAIFHLFSLNSRVIAIGAPMTTDADGSHFDARAQFRGFFAVTWNDVHGERAPAGVPE